MFGGSDVRVADYAIYGSPELAANVARVLPDGLIADVDRASWTVPPVLSTVRELGSVPWEETLRRLPGTSWHRPCARRQAS